MPGTKDFHFTPQDLMNLLVHYTGGQVPMNGEVREFLVHPHMRRKIALAVASDEWDRQEPLFVSYDGKRIATWAKGDAQQEFAQRNDTPTRQ